MPYTEQILVAIGEEGGSGTSEVTFETKTSVDPADIQIISDSCIDEICV